MSRQMEFKFASKRYEALLNAFPILAKDSIGILAIFYFITILVLAIRHYSLSKGSFPVEDFLARLDSLPALLVFLGETIFVLFATLVGSARYAYEYFFTDEYGVTIGNKIFILDRCLGRRIGWAEFQSIMCKGGEPIYLEATRNGRGIGFSIAFMDPDERSRFLSEIERRRPDLFPVGHKFYEDLTHKARG